MKHLKIVIFISLFLSSTCFSGETWSGSRLTMKDCGALIIDETKKDEAIPPGMAFAVGEFLIKQGVELATNWIKDIEGKFSGYDSVTTIAQFYCAPNSVYKTITYERGVFDSSGKLIKEYAVIDSRLDYPRVSDSAGVFFVAPTHISYFRTIAKYGDTKDIVLKYTFEFIKSENNPSGKNELSISSKALQPITFKSVTEGDTFLDESDGYLMGSTDLVSMPKHVLCDIKAGADCKEPPSLFRLKLEVIETPAGTGDLLAAKISKEVAAALDKNHDKVSEKLVSAILGNSPDPKPKKDDSAKK